MTSLAGVTMTSLQNVTRCDVDLDIVFLSLRHGHVTGCDIRRSEVLTIFSVSPTLLILVFQYSLQNK